MLYGTIALVLVIRLFWLEVESGEPSVNITASRRCREAREHPKPQGAPTPRASRPARPTDTGGPNAILEASESISALRRLIATLGPEQSGKIFNHTSRKYPWGFFEPNPMNQGLPLCVWKFDGTHRHGGSTCFLQIYALGAFGMRRDIRTRCRCSPLSWERTVRSVLERVERLPTNVQGEIATCVGKYIHFAGAATDHASLIGLIEAAAGERAKVAQKSTVDPRWSALALAEAWCVSRLGLFNGNMNRLSAMSVITAIEAFAFAKYPDDQIRGQVMLQMNLYRASLANRLSGAAVNVALNSLDLRGIVRERDGIVGETRGRSCHCLGAVNGS